MQAIEGARYRVISDSYNFFQSGEIVVALETSVVPYCVREEKYIPGCKIKDLGPDDCRPLLDTELEMVDDKYALLLKFCDEFCKVIDMCYKEACSSGCIARIELEKTKAEALIVCSAIEKKLKEMENKNDEKTV